MSPYRTPAPMPPSTALVRAEPSQLLKFKTIECPTVASSTQMQITERPDALELSAETKTELSWRA